MPNKWTGYVEQKLQDPPQKNVKFHCQKLSFDLCGKTPNKTRDTRTSSRSSAARQHLKITSLQKRSRTTRRRLWKAGPPAVTQRRVSGGLKIEFRFSSEAFSDLAQKGFGLTFFWGGQLTFSVSRANRRLPPPPGKTKRGGRIFSPPSHRVNIFHWKRVFLGAYQTHIVRSVSIRLLAGSARTRNTPPPLPPPFLSH